MDADGKQVFDINWSSDGSVIAAGFDKSVVMLDMRNILSVTSENPNYLSGNTTSAPQGSLNTLTQTHGSSQT